MGETWEQALTDLISGYRDVERRALALPAFSLMPIVISYYYFLKFSVFWLVDLLLILVNLTIFLRNLFPGQWRYKKYIWWQYVQYIFQWIFSGETLQIASIVIRPLVCSLLSGHMRARLSLLRQLIHLDNRLSKERQTSLLSTIDEELKWCGRGFITAFRAFVITIGGASLTIYGLLEQTPFSSWLQEEISADPEGVIFVIFLVGYYLSIFFFTVLMSSFLIKRGLMLGGSGQGAYFPGGLKGNGAYGPEKRMFRLTGFTPRESLIDIWLSFLSIYFIPFGILALIRRSKLQRL